ncbi:hypothetical protein Ancab_038496 [Ancistrocladus abbreviatus]
MGMNLPPLLIFLAKRFEYRYHFKHGRFTFLSPPTFELEAVEGSSKNSTMEEYLEYMKTLRTRINDVEDQAAKISVEEQMQITIIHTLEKDLNSATSETRRMKEDTDQLLKAKCQICSQIIDKQKRIASLEYDSSTLSQTLALIQQERNCLSAKLVEKRAYYTKVTEEMNAKLQEQQDWLDSQKFKEKDTDASDMRTIGSEKRSSNESNYIADSLGDARKDHLIRELDAAETKLEEITNMKFNLVSETNKMKQFVEQVKCQINGFKPELRAMDFAALEEEHKTLLSDKGGELEFLKTLENQIDKMKGICHTINCACGQEYKVEMDLHF